MKFQVGTEDEAPEVALEGSEAAAGCSPMFGKFRSSGAQCCMWKSGQYTWNNLNDADWMLTSGKAALKRGCRIFHAWLR